MTSTSTSTRRPRRGLRRAVLGALALGAIAVPGVFGGCVASFDPPTKINALRVLGVTADKPYARPGDEVTFKLTYQDALGDADDGARPVSITWIGGCVDPFGDEYYGCYESLAETLQGVKLDPADPLKACKESDNLKCGLDLDTFTLKLPDDIVSRRPKPTSGPYYGLAYVFFLVCAGVPLPVQDAGSGEAGSFPLGCFDLNDVLSGSPNPRRLGAESFVPGYTQIYVFDDGRTNANPEIQDMTFDGESLPADASDVQALKTVSRCGITDEERKQSGCGAQDPFAECESHELKAIVDPSVGEDDPDAKDKPLTEVVWVSYFADQGDITNGIKLVNDATTGYIDAHEAKWIPPSEPGIVTLWAVLRDARGGSSVMKRLVRVE